MKNEHIRVTKDPQRFILEKNAIIYKAMHETLRIEPWGHNSIRIRSTLAKSFSESQGALIDTPAKSNATVAADDEDATLINGQITAKLSSNGWLRFYNSATQEVLFEEKPVQIVHNPSRYFRAVEGNLWSAELNLKAYDGEQFFGLGQRRHGRLNQKGCVFDLLQANCEVNIPFAVSNRGYGFLWNNPALGRAELGYTGTRWTAQATHQIDYWVTAGATPSAIMSQYADATGHVPEIPDWATGFWQCKLRYKTQDELLSVARGYKERGLPISVIVIDFFHWPMMGDMCFDEQYWPDPEGLLSELKEMGIETMVSVWPALNGDSRHYDEFYEKGCLLETTKGVATTKQFFDTNPPGMVYLHYYDPTNPEARQLFWEKVKDNYYKQGFRVFWLDCNEPEMDGKEHDNLLLHEGTGAQCANLYPKAHEQTFYEGMKAEGQEKVLNLCRSAWAGSQRYGTAVWSGDIESTFEVLTGQVKAGLNIAMSGIPWWTTDIGGFLHGDPTTDYFQELIVRWFQFGVFCPLFRLHGCREPADDKGGADNEVWCFGEKAYGIIQKIMHMRERIRPYIHKQMDKAHQDGTPVMRPLFFDFPDDGATWHIDDQYMFGPDILVCPVTQQGQTDRNVYLPSGASWTCAWNGTTYEGGQTLKSVSAPLETIPIYLKNGAPIPLKQ